MKILANQNDISQKITELANQIFQNCPVPENLVLVGIQRRGVQLSERIAQAIADNYQQNIPLGVLDITFYRDDLSMVAQQPIVHSTDLPFDLDDKYVVLVDDVIYTGRTSRAALDALVDFGRAKVIRLAVLVDRSGRELPIQADYAGWAVETNKNQIVHVCVQEIDNEEKIVLTDSSK